MEKPPCPKEQLAQAVDVLVAAVRDVNPTRDEMWVYRILAAYFGSRSEALTDKDYLEGVAFLERLTAEVYKTATPTLPLGIPIEVPGT